MGRIVFVLFLLLSTLNGLARDITFSHITTDDGLSQISVNALYKDERNFIWIGTREGLNCYNGNNIKTYKLQKNDPNSLFCNNVLKIAGNGKGMIYLLCAEGLAEYSIREDKFTTLLQEGNISAIHFDKQLFIAKKNEVYTYNPNTSKFYLYYALPSKTAIISALYFNNEGTLYIGTANEGLYTLSYENSNKRKLQNPIPKANITSIYQDSSADLWIGSWEHGLFRITKGEVKNYVNDPKNDKSILSNFIRSCCEDNQGNLWIGTFRGLDKYTKETGEFKHHLVGDSSDGLTHASVWCIIKDHQGTLWLGTYFGGVNYFNPEYEIYTRYKTSANEQAGLSSPIVGKMLEDNHNNLWICTEGGGVNVYNRKSKKFKWYTANSSKNSISHNNVKAIYYDDKQEIMWIGTHLGGLNKLDLRTEQFTHYRSVKDDPNTLPSDIVKDIVPYKTDLVLGTENGICLFSPQTGKSQQLLNNPHERFLTKAVADLFIDHQGLLWIAVTGEGVFTYNFDTKKLTNYRHDASNKKSISNNNINSITEDSHNNLWISTSGRGLDLYNYATNSFDNFDSQSNGLSSDCVYKVCESGGDKLLVITNQEFLKFDHKKSKFDSYSIKNGFPLTAINENALYLTRDGEVFLGGVQGMVSFYEKALDFTKKPYNIVLSRLIVNDKEVKVNDDSGILHQSFSETPEITLESNHSVFSIEFASTNYIPANRDKLMYKLEGFSNEWIGINGQNIITYTNLNPGKYTLIIKSDNPNSPYQPEVKLHIEILPPVYKTGYAYILYFLIISGILYSAVKFYKERVRLQTSLKYEQKHLQDVEKLNQSKLRFFTNISHEFRTPLTLIIGQLEMLLQIQSFIPSVYNKILNAYKSSIQLKELVSELLDFRKQEQGYMKIKVSEHDIIDFVYENYLFFYANTKEIEFKFEREIDTLNVWYDAKQMQKVINNLLSNAFKYTKAGETITIRVRKEDAYAIVEIEDTGMGIDAKAINKIFDRFYQTENNDPSITNTGTGIGLALTKGIIDLHHGTIDVSSELGKGTCFTFKLKLGKDHFDADQISEQKELNKTQIEFNNQQAKSELDKDNLIEDMVLEEKRISGVKMLIVEDNESLKAMLVGVFEPFYLVVTASDGVEGWEKVQSEHPQIVLSDVLMPRMSGIELCKVIKTNIDTCHIPVVLLTARVSVQHNLEGLRIGADDYIAKPFNVNILISRCNNLVNSRIVLQEKFSKQPQMTPQMLATNNLDKELLDKAMLIIETHLDNPEFNVNVFAREIGMSRTNLFAKIKTITGQTPNDFISIIRLRKAAFMLRNNPELNITDISSITGFSSARYFSKCFKDLYHTTPLAYRNDGLATNDKDEPDEIS